MKESRGITPLRTILQNCLNHIENLETNRSICDNYDKEFQDLKQFSETLKVQKEFACTEGEKEVNRKKNRYKDILPFNVSRVILSEYAGIPGSDYINANFIKGASGSPAYIASQGPLPNTVNDFWRMVVECEVQVIVMACNAQESGKHKCENYWVEKEGEEKRFGMVQICLVKASTVCPDFLVRTMRLKYTNVKDVTEERTVCQFHYSAWPDHGVPPLVRPLLDMVRLVRDTQASETLPVLVHCSAGCGRTGTICAIDFVWGLLRAGKLTEEFSLFNLVRDMRKQRVAMVQTKEQYILVHQAVRELFKEQLQVIESHPYENIDFNGVPLIKDFEEPVYDTICIQKEENCDEKQDKSELKEKGEEVESRESRVTKTDSAPPLPRKKRPNVLFSKQEKEAENLTEKNRSSFTEKEKERIDAPPNSLLGKPRIAKLRAFFEKSPTTKERTALKDRGSQTVSRSHSLGAIRKPLTSDVFEPLIERNKPSNTFSSSQVTTESGKLKYSKPFSKSVPLIKRSKSLKTFSQSSQLCMSPPQVLDRKSSKTYQVPMKTYESENRPTVGIENFWKKSTTTFDLNQSFSELAKECSKRRRSLESLMGDAPPTITWPTVVMTPDKDNSRIKVGSKPLDYSPKSSSNNLQVKKTADLLKHQLQRLSLETEKKISTLASGIGIRERRNSFRQAVSKSDFQNVFPDYREQQHVIGKLLGNENVSSHRDGPQSKNFKSSNETAQSNDQPDGPVFSEREDLVDSKLIGMKSKSVFDVKKYKMLDRLSTVGESASQVRKINDRHPSQQNSLVLSVNPIVLDSRSHKGMISSKSSRTLEDPDRSSDSKNLFLKKLNSEIMEEVERDTRSNLQYNESRSRSSFEDADKTSVPRFISGSVSVRSDSKKIYMNVKPTSSYSVDSEALNDEDNMNRYGEENDKMFQSSAHIRQNSNFQDNTTCMKSPKNSKSLDCYKCYASAPVSHTQMFNRTNPSHKGINYPSSAGENNNNMRREECLRSKDPFYEEVRPFFPVSHKKKVCYVVPSKVHSSNENEATSFSSYRRDLVFNPDIVTITSDYENSRKKLILPPKTSNIEKNSRAIDSVQWSHSGSSVRSPGEMSSTDQHLTKGELSKLIGQYENKNCIKSEVKVIKKTELDKSRMENKGRMVDSNKITQTNEPYTPISPKNQKRPEELKMVNTSVDYGLLNTAKQRHKTSTHSKDDFLLGEPTAPPRVKRHASVTGLRNNLNGSNHVSAWVPTEKKFGSDRSTISQVEKNAWTESFGVDLDAIAASMQQNKRESTAAKDGGWSGKSHLNTSSSSNGKKKQHYF